MGGRSTFGIVLPVGLDRALIMISGRLTGW